MPTATPAAVKITCPRCYFPHLWVNSQGTLFRCSGCEWEFTLSTQAPTGTDTATLAVGGTALTVASGGASFTSGMLVLFDTGLNAEVLTVGAGATGTNIPVSAAVKAHSANATFGQLLISVSRTGFGLEIIPPQTPTAAEVAAFPGDF